MAQLRLALAQVNSTVGDLDGNADQIVTWTRRAAEAGAHLVAFPEMMLTGYPVEDLALRASFVEASRDALQRLARGSPTRGSATCPWSPATSTAPGRRGPLGRPGGLPLNAAAWLHGGEVLVRSAKHHLPNYGVFDEYRIFARGDRLPVVRLHGVDVATAICEDLWQDGGPVSVTSASGAGLLLVINASPYERNKDDARLELCASRAREAGCALAYVNMVGGQDELVFDGDSVIVGPDGSPLSRAPQFVEHLLVTDLDLPAAGRRRGGPRPRRRPGRHHDHH
ncbi:nitrilase-related carbon-nitrogen hydrolase [Actinomadura luteofluorescens]|uniref:nitrilase-related carbon-nitrogen hydrolase n=1 Tax=Actinomadura luteofluorescens TaxID=46163 RepID=UPI003634F907